MYLDGMIMPLNEKLKRDLRTRGHALKPVVTVGNAGVTESVQRELELSLEHHELMKVKISSGDRDARSEVIRKLCDITQADLVQAIGHVALIYRSRRKKG